MYSRHGSRLLWNDFRSGEAQLARGWGEIAQARSPAAGPIARGSLDHEQPRRRRSDEGNARVCGVASAREMRSRARAFVPIAQAGPNRVIARQPSRTAWPSLLVAHSLMRVGAAVQCAMRVRSRGWVSQKPSGADEAGRGVGQERRIFGHDAPLGALGCGVVLRAKPLAWSSVWAFSRVGERQSQASRGCLSSLSPSSSKPKLAPDTPPPGASVSQKSSSRLRSSAQRVTASWAGRVLRGCSAQSAARGTRQRMAATGSTSSVGASTRSVSEMMRSASARQMPSSA